MFRPLLIVFVFYCEFLCPIFSWSEWKYETQWVPINPIFTVNGENTMNYTYWESIWGTTPPQGIDSTNPIAPPVNDQKAPRPRRGHSLLHVKTRKDSIYKGYTYLIMFGGRDNEDRRTHIPRTYAVDKVNGSLQFTTYDKRPVNPCNDVTGQWYTEKERASCTYNSSRPNVGVNPALINVGIFYNDVWAYRMCPRSNAEGKVSDGQHLPGQVAVPQITLKLLSNHSVPLPLTAHPYTHSTHPCHNHSHTVSPSSQWFTHTYQRRWADLPCLGEGWVLWEPGAREGGCLMELGTTVCTTPSER